MADQGKSLKISSSIDTKDINKLRGGLKDLAAESTKLSSALKSIGDVFKNLSKSLAESSSGFKAFNMSMKESLGMFRESRREINQMINMVGRLGTAMRGVGGFGRMGMGGGPTMPPGGTGNTPAAPAGGGGVGGPALMLPLPGGGFAIVPPATGGGTGGGGRAGTPLQNVQDYAVARSTLGATGDALKFAGNFALQGQQNFAALQQATTGTMLRTAYGGDLATIHAYQSIQNLGLMDKAIGTTAARLGFGVSATQGALEGFRSGGVPGMFMAAGKSVAGYGGAETTGEFQRALGEQFQATLRAQTEKAPGQNLMFQHLQETAGIRATLAPLTQGRGIESIYQGIGFGLSPGETLGAIQPLISQFGATAALGGRGRRGLFQLSQEMGLRGFDAGSMGQAMGAMMGGMGGARPEEAFKKLEAVFQRATAAGIKDSALKQGIGEEIAKASLVGGGGLNVEAVGDAMIRALTMGGRQVVGGDVERMRSGVGIVGGLAGANPLIAAQMMTQLRKSGVADEFQQNWLMTASMQELMAGGGATGAAFFGSEAAARRAGRAHIGDAVSLALQNIGGGGVAGGRARDLMNQFGSWQAAIRDPKAGAEAASLFASILGPKGAGFLPGNEMEIAAGLRFGAATGEGPLPTKAEGRFFDTGRAYKGAVEAARAKEFEEEKKNVDNIREAIKGIGTTMSAFQHVPASWDAATNTINALKDLVGAINETTIEKTKALTERVKEVREGVVKSFGNAAARTAGGIRGVSP